jgi:hypothetical protein
LVPFDLDDHGEQSDGRSVYRIDAADEFLAISRQFEPKKWTKVLKLKLTPQHWGALLIDVIGSRIQQILLSCANVSACDRLRAVGSPSWASTLKCVEVETVEIAIEEGKSAAVLTEYFGMIMGNPTWIRPNHD